VSGDRQLVLEPVVSWPRHAEAGRTYLMTVDLRTPADTWSYDEEEIEFGLMVDGAPRFRVEALNDPSVVVHRFGGTYGPARFAVTTGTDTGPGALWLTVTNRWGMPVRKIELPAQVVTPNGSDPAGGQPPHAVPAPVPAPASPSADVPARTAEVAVSHSAPHRPWAAWIGHQLEHHGLGTVLRRRSPLTEASPEETLAALLATAGRVLLVLDDDYLDLGRHTAADWDLALAALPPDDLARLAAARTGTAALPPALAALDPVPLEGLDAGQACHRLLHRLGVRTASPDVAGDGPRFPGDTSTLWNVPRATGRFVGRDDLLDDIRAAFTSGARRCVLHGVPGVGKSQTAREYAHRFRNEYDLVWYVNAGHRASAREQLAELAVRLGLPTGESTGERIRALLDALRRGEPHRRWLLVFDGADAVGRLDGLLPEEGPGHLLVTAVHRDDTPDGPAVRTVHVPPFTRDESTAFVRRRAARLTSAEAESVADAVQDLPLLLNQAAAWLAVNESTEVRAYVDQISSGDLTAPDHPSDVARTWLIARRTLATGDPEASALLDLFGFFSPDSIPAGLIPGAPADELPEPVARLTGDPGRWRRVLRTLRSTDLVDATDPAGGTEATGAGLTLRMHRLQHGYLRAGLSAVDRAAAAHAACRVLVAAAPEDRNDRAHWARYARIIPHLDVAGAFDSTDPEVQSLVLDCTNYLRVRGEYRAGLELTETALRHWRALFRQADRNLLLLDYYRAIMLRRLGRYREAEAAGRAAIALLAAGDPDDEQLLLAKQGLGGALWALGDYAEARDLFAEIWEVNRRLHGEDHPRALAQQHNYAAVLAQLGRYEESLELETVVRDTRRRGLGPTEPSTLESGTVRAGLLRALGQYKEANTLQAETVTQVREALGLRHPQTLRAEHGQALCLSGVGNHQDSETLLRSVLRDSEQVHGPDHPDTLAVRADLASLRRRLGAVEQAVGPAEQAVEGHVRLLGEAHPFAAGTLGNLALVRAASGDVSAALRMSGEALSRMRVAVGGRHPWALACALNTSGVRAQAGDAEGAAGLSHSAARGADQVLGPRHPLTLLARAAEALDLRTLGRADEADALERQALQGLAETLGEEHHHTVAVRRRRRPYWDFEPQPV
jgi:tetratricopeptide (TPR) repeat protein